MNSNGESFKPGDILIQKDLAKTLRLISKNGKKGFYEGTIDLADIFSYRPLDEVPLKLQLTIHTKDKRYSGNKQDFFLFELNGRTTLCPQTP